MNTFILVVYRDFFFESVVLVSFARTIVNIYILSGNCNLNSGNNGWKILKMSEKLCGNSVWSKTQIYEWWSLLGMLESSFCAIVDHFSWQNIKNGNNMVSVYGISY